MTDQNKRTGSDGFSDLMNELDKTTKAVHETRTTLQSIMAPFKKAAERFTQVSGVAKQVWDDYGQHVWRPVGYVGGKMWNGYKSLFNRVAYTKDDNGEPLFSKKRAAAMVVATAVALTGAVHFQMGVPAAIELAKDSRVLFGTEQMEVYLNRPDLIEEGRYEVTGCLDYPCSDDNTLYYKIEDNVFMDMEYLFSRGHFYDPEYIAGAMSNESNQCSVEYVGTTSRFLQRTIGWMPQIISAECTPISIGPGGAFDSSSLLHGIGDSTAADVELAAVGTYADATAGAHFETPINVSYDIPAAAVDGGTAYAPYQQALRMG